MFVTKKISITGTHRAEKRQNKLKKENWYTPSKRQVKLQKNVVLIKYQKKFGYDYDSNESKTLKYLEEDFANQTMAYLGKGEWTKNLGTKDKYEKNLKYGHPLKKNPLMRIFGKLQHKISMSGKQQALLALKSLKK